MKWILEKKYTFVHLVEGVLLFLALFIIGAKTNIFGLRNVGNPENAENIYYILVWLFPTLVGLLLILILISYFKKR
jgi:hypothetical protein